MRWKTKSLLLCFVMQLLAACANSMRPVHRVPRDAPTTGRFIVSMKPSTSKGEMQETLMAVMKVADDAKIYGYVHTVAKAITVKLSPYSLEIVCNLCGSIMHVVYTSVSV